MFGAACFGASAVLLMRSWKAWRSALVLTIVATICLVWLFGWILLALVMWNLRT